MKKRIIVLIVIVLGLLIASIMHNSSKLQPTAVKPKDEVSTTQTSVITVPEEKAETVTTLVDSESKTIEISDNSINTQLDIELEAKLSAELDNKKVLELCTKVGTKLGSVDIKDCIVQDLKASGFWTDEGNALAYKDYLPIENKKTLGRVLVIGGIHGDEYSSVSIMFKWMKILNRHHSGIIHWKFIPVSNPDGLFQRPATRTNSNGIDLNRNFPSSDWNELALDYWRDRAYSAKRRYPGKQAASETEIQWLVKTIDEFNPNIVVSIHAPYELLDYDGPDNPPTRIGNLYLSQLGIFPGSLGNYGGVDLQKPIVTLELPSAGIMPSNKEINTMWRDLVRWLIDKLNKQ